MEEPGPAIKRILLVDDEQALLEAQSEILYRLGYFVASSHSAAHALELFNANPHEFDLIIADEIMPGMAGSEMCRRMREVRPELPVIIVTAGLELPRTLKKASLYGIGQVLLKPVLKKELRRAIEKVAGGMPIKFARGR